MLMRILDHLDDEKLSIRPIAAVMALKVQTFQTKLKGEGQDFSGLLSEIRNAWPSYTSKRTYRCKKLPGG